MVTCDVRVYGPLNDFLPAARRQVATAVTVADRPAVKDVVEGLGVPHPEIDLILINGDPAPFERAVRDGDRIAVFPRFTSIDVGAVTLVRPPALEPLRFVADVHLGTLARRLRLAGFDTAYSNDAGDDELAAIAQRDGRALLTRDRALLRRRIVAHGYVVRETNPPRQFAEVLRHFDAAGSARPFSRCVRCNGRLQEVPKASVARALLPRTREHHDRFWQCDRCGQLYWRGSHWEKLRRAVESAIAQA
jgi:uncharacterized protein with PIN domain